MPVALVGIPIDANSSHLFGAAEAPAAIRKILHSGASNDTTEQGVTVFDLIDDRGDLAVENVTGSAADLDLITAQIGDIARSGQPVLALGGDHSVTFPILRGIATAHSALTVVHIDAHPDLYNDLDGNPFSHASPFARALEAGCMTRLVQVGIRTATSHQRDQAARWGVETIPPRALSTFDPTSIDGPVYLSVDLDGLDPSVAPGVAHHEPGGLSFRELLDIVDGLAGRLVGADIVELVPARDVVDMTAAVAAKLVKEIAAALVAA